MQVSIKTKARASAACLFMLLTSSGFADEQAQVQQADQADSFSDWLAKGSLFGEIKTMTFFKEFSGTIDNTRTHSFGGDIQYRSPVYNGLSFGVGEYSASGFGLNPKDPDNKEGYLPSQNVNVLGKAFVRYQGGGFDVKAGRFGIDTPFANEVEGRTMIPALYQGVGGSYQYAKDSHLKFYGYRIYKFKAMSSDDFGKGDAGSPEITDTSMPSVESNGFTTFGVRYGQLYNAKAEAWYYDFDKRARLAFLGAEVPVHSLAFDGWTPYWGAQYVHEWDTSNQVYPYNTTSVNTDLYSGRLGVNSRKHTFYVAYSKVPQHEGDFLSGGFFAPYSYGIYNTTPLEEGQPLLSMVTANQPGSALAVRYTYHPGRYLAVLGYTRLELKDSSGIYYPLQAMTENAGFMILGYHITPRLYFEFEGDYINSPNAQTGNYHAERFRLIYKFGKLMSDNDY